MLRFVCSFFAVSFSIPFFSLSPFLSSIYLGSLVMKSGGMIRRVVPVFSAVVDDEIAISF